MCSALIANNGLCGLARVGEKTCGVIGPILIEVRDRGVDDGVGAGLSGFGLQHVGDVPGVIKDPVRQTRTTNPSAAGTHRLPLFLVRAQKCLDTYTRRFHWNPARSLRTVGGIDYVDGRARAGIKVRHG